MKLINNQDILLIDEINRNVNSGTSIYLSCDHFTQLALLVETSDLKTFGYKKVFEPLINDIKKLEVEGINIDYNNTVINLRGTVCFFVADNLEANAVGGFVESFNAKSCNLNYKKAFNFLTFF